MVNCIKKINSPGVNWKKLKYDFRIKERNPNSEKQLTTEALRFLVSISYISISKDLLLKHWLQSFYQKLAVA